MADDKVSFSFESKRYSSWCLYNKDTDVSTGRFDTLSDANDCLRRDVTWAKLGYRPAYKTVTFEVYPLPDGVDTETKNG